VDGRYKMSELNWEVLWKNPVEIAKLVTDNQRSLMLLKSIRDRIKREKGFGKKVKKSGYVYEGERKSKLVEEIMGIDSQLADKIKPLSDRTQILNAIQARIPEIQNAIETSEKTLKTVLKREGKTLGMSEAVVDRFIEVLIEVTEIYKREIRNLALNEVYENEIMAASQTKEFVTKLSYFENQAKRALARAKENQLLQKRVIGLMAEIKRLKERAND
jgi:hypothetical protein